MEIDDYIPLARKVAGWYISTTPYKADDILGQAYLGLCLAWDKYDPNSGRPFEGYAVTAMRNKIADFLYSDHTVPIPKLEYKKRYENDEFIPKKVVDQEEWLPSYNEESNLEQDEIIELVTEGVETDKLIIDMLLKDESYRTIGDALGVSHVTVLNRIKRMRERYERLR